QPRPSQPRCDDGLEPRSDLRRQAGHGLLVEWMGQVEDEMGVAQVQVDGEVLVDLLGRAYGLMLPRRLTPVAREQLIVDAPRLRGGVADGGHADIGAAP